KVLPHGREIVPQVVATAEWRNVRDAAYSANPGWDGPVRAIRGVFACLFGMTKQRLPKPRRVISQRHGLARAELLRGSQGL
ncbi:MAG TPA: hypothetical protein VKO38_00640, partial [Wenzhouxiangella sp.]|nr:hypothetical protein [Wenzhouxiangella sp.]